VLPRSTREHRSCDLREAIDSERHGIEPTAVHIKLYVKRHVYIRGNEINAG